MNYRFQERLETLTLS